MPPIPLRTHPKLDDDPPRRWRRWKWLLLLLVPLIAWQAWRAVASGRHFAKAKELQASLADANLSADKRQQLFQSLRGEMSQLSTAQRQALSSEMQKQRERELDHYFTMSKADQKRYLDAQINRMQQAKAAGSQGRPGGPPAGTTMATSFGKSPGAPGGPGGKAMTPDDIEKRKKVRLDHSSVDLRAKSDRFRKELEQRMKERGISPPAGRGR